MAIEDWAPELVTVLEGVAGLEQVHNYDELPGSLEVFPAAVILPLRGSQQIGASAPLVAVHQVQVTVYVSAQILPEALGAAVPFIKKVRDALASHVKLNGTVSYCLPADPPSPFYEGPGSIKYGDKDLCGIIFHVTVKETESFTVQA